MAVGTIMNESDLEYLRNINTSPGPNAGRSIDAADQTAWLVEFNASVCEAPNWYFIGDDSDDFMTGDANKALRFARRVDAEQFIAREGWTEAFASEHVYVERPSYRPYKEVAVKRLSLGRPLTWRERLTAVRKWLGFAPFHAPAADRSAK
jgi:hypothetical protein